MSDNYSTLARVDVKKDTGDASLFIGLILGAVVGAAFTYVYLTRSSEQGARQLPLPFGEPSSDNNA